MFSPPPVQDSQSPKPSRRRQTPPKELMALSPAIPDPTHPGTQHSRPHNRNTSHPTFDKQHVRIFKTISKWRKSDTLSSNSLPKLLNQHLIHAKLSIKEDQSIKSSQQVSTRAFHESLTNPTHENNCITAYLPPQKKRHIGTGPLTSNPFTILSYLPESRQNRPASWRSQQLLATEIARHARL